MTEREREQRYRYLADLARPCPKCGCEPEIDLGLIGAEHAPGMEFFHCPAIWPQGGDHHCGVSAQGLEAWNHQPAIDELIAANTTGDLPTIKRQLAATEFTLTETRALLAKAALQLQRVHTDAWHQCKGHGVKTTDGRDFSLFQVNRCAELAGELDRAIRAALEGGE